MVLSGTQTDHSVHLDGLVSEMVRNDTKTIRFVNNAPHLARILNSRPPSTTPSDGAAFSEPLRHKGRLIERGSAEHRGGFVDEIVPSRGSVEGKKVKQKSSKFRADIVQRPLPKA